MSDLQSGHGVVKAKLGSSITNVVASALFLLPLTVHSFATPAGNFIDLSFEELANIQVTSVSKKAERLADAAASIFLITAEDIQQSGARSLPEVLRLAPNLQVAQTSASGYAISARGFNGSNSSAPNKLLVLIDGRSVYSPLFSGIFWDVQDVMLEDVERIEVISGPAGTLWGVNAVNGVINIITRSARDTQGNLAVIGAGNRENDLAWRFGGTLENGANYRVYGTYFDRHHLSKDDGTAVNDALHKGQIGFRADWQHAGTEWTVQGNAYDGAVEQPAPGSVATGTQFDLGTIPVSGVNLSGRWAQAMGDGSSISLQAYYDHTKRTVPPTFGEALNVVDLQFQHSLLPIDIHTLAWGANYRYGMSRVDNSVYFAFLPADVNQKWSSIFARDEVALSDTLRLVLGGRVERNVYTGNEFLPSARLAWKAAPDHLLWAAASRTVRAPSRLDRDAYVPGVPPFLLDGGRAVVSESARVYEAGYRGQFGDRMTYSVTAFHTAYDHLRTQEVAPSGTYLIFSNGMEGTSSGVEMWGTYQASSLWRLSAGYSALREKFTLKPESNDTAAPGSAGKDPAHTYQLRSSLKLAQNRALDFSVRHVAELSGPAVPAYTAVDARFAWALNPNTELSVTGKNLLGRHAEYGDIADRSEIEPSIFVKLSWRS